MAGVDVDFFTYTPPGDSGVIAFTGSMDWLANIDGIDWFLEQAASCLDEFGP